jgi:predicted glycoside hydrolase/deacetylase ChbG (UPF0249 family)
VVEHLRSRRLDAQLYHPTWSSDFEHCITDQLTAFEQLYGHPPSHVDGHQHLHLAFNALFARALASVKRLRRPVNRTRNESRASRRLGRAILARAMRVRYVTTDWCFSIRALDPGLGGTGVAGKLALARQASVEVFVHPGWEDELAVLGSPAWRAALAEYSVGSFLDLAVDGRVS